MAAGNEFHQAIEVAEDLRTVFLMKVCNDHGEMASPSYPRIVNLSESRQ